MVAQPSEWHRLTRWEKQCPIAAYHMALSEFRYFSRNAAATTHPQVMLTYIICAETEFYNMIAYASVHPSPEPAMSFT